MISKTDYELYADCIRSDQMSAREVNNLMESNSAFKKWYHKTYINTGRKSWLKKLLLP